MIALPKMPVHPDTSPVALEVFRNHSVTIKINANAAIASPSEFGATVQPMVEVIALVAMPKTTNHHPLHTRPFFENAQSIPMTSNSTKTTPKPSWAFVVMILLPTVPIRPNTTPMTLAVDVESAQPIAMHTNALERPPAPLLPTVMHMVEMVSAVQVPIFSRHHPLHTSPSSQNAQAVPMTADSF